jgi:hypothetical protein
MNRRSFLSTLALTVAAFFFGYPKPKPLRFHATFSAVVLSSSGIVKYELSSDHEFINDGENFTVDILTSP